MAVYNSSSDAANTAVRAFLTKVGEYYLGHSYNTGSGNGKKLWLSIRNVDFDGCCAYCGLSHDALQIEHLLMFNRAEYGLHHPGNTVPCCKSCNKRKRLSDRSYSNWEQHLEQVCGERQELQLFTGRRQKILANLEKYSYPVLNTNEQHSIRVIANSLYENIKAESSRSLELYMQLDEAFVK